MRITTQRRVLAVLIACSVASSVSYAVSLPAFDLPEIGGIDLPSTAIAGDSVRMTIKATKDGTSACGLSIDFGDGTNHGDDIVPGDEGVEFLGEVRIGGKPAANAQ